MKIRSVLAKMMMLGVMAVAVASPAARGQAGPSGGSAQSSAVSPSALSARRPMMPLRPSGVTVADLVIEEAMKYIGTPYRWGGKTPKGFDCAGFTRYIYSKFGVELASSAAPQYKAGKILKNDEIRKGDLVFYGSRGGSRSIGHVGIVTKVDSTGFCFIHSATSSGICISHSSEAYYRKRYIGACRIIDKIVNNFPPVEPSTPVSPWLDYLYKWSS